MNVLLYIANLCLFITQMCMYSYLFMVSISYVLAMYFITFLKSVSELFRKQILHLFYLTK